MSSAFLLAAALSYLAMVAAWPTIPASDNATPNRCLFEPYLEQNIPFFLCVEHTDISCVSTNYSRVLLGDSLASPTSLRLALCIVSEDMECNYHSSTADCIYENVEYRIRVTMPTNGYLHVVDSFLEVVPSFQMASAFFLSATGTGPYMTVGGSYLHIADKRPIAGQTSQVLTSQGSGLPLVFNDTSRDNESQAYFTMYLVP